MDADGADENGDTLSEQDLRWISRSIRSQILSSSDGMQPADVNQKRIEIERLLDRVLILSGRIELNAAHRVAAWNALCSIIDQSLESEVPELIDSVWRNNIWTRTFTIYLDFANVARPKSARQLLATLTKALQKNAGEGKFAVRQHAVKRSLQHLIALTDPYKAKVSAQLLGQFVTKDIIGIDDVLDSVTPRDSEDDTHIGRLRYLLECLFCWFGKGDVGSTIAQVSCTLIEKLEESLKEEISSPARNTDCPVWAGALIATFGQSAINFDDLRAHLFPALFRLNVRDYICFLEVLQNPDRLNGKGPKQPSHSSYEQLYFLALQSGNELGFLHGPDRVISAEGKGQTYVSSRVVRGLLNRDSRHARLTGLHILIMSRATTSPFSEDSLILLKLGLKRCVADTDADFRCDVVGFLQNLVDRLRAIMAFLERRNRSSYLDDHERIVAVQQYQYHNKFIHWILQFISWELRPTATYQRHVSALKFLTILARSGLDPAVRRESYSKSALAETKWPLDVSLLSDSIQDSLLDLLFDPFDDIRQGASLILMLYCDVSFRQDKGNFLMRLGTFFERSQQLLFATGREDQGDGVAHLYGLFARLNSPERIVLQPSWISRSDLLHHLLDRMELVLQVAGRDIVEAIKNYPMHGLLVSLRYVVIQGCDEGIASLQNRFLVCLNGVWNVVQPILCNDAPEGFLPDGLDEGSGLTKETLSYSWRALKESSLLMHVLVTVGGSSDLMNQGFLSQFNELCFRQLVELRHPGAFATVAQTWIACCVQCSRSNEPLVLPLMKRRYLEFLELLRTNITINTRRSAGLPSLLCGLLMAPETEISFGEVFNELETICRWDPSSVGVERGNLPQVHAFNCVREVFRNTKLGERAGRLVVRGLRLAADALRSDVWAIRNCGLMLFRAVMDRLIGAGDIQTTDDQIPRTLLSIDQHHGLFDVVLSLLSYAIGEINNSLRNESFFPALHLLQHMEIPMDRADETLVVIRSLTCSPSWHVRAKAAQTLASLLLTDRVTVSMSDLLDLNVDDHNSLHGTLLAVRYMAIHVNAPRRQRTGSSVVSRVSPYCCDWDFNELARSVVEIYHQDTCPITKAASLDVLSVLVANGQSRPIDLGIGTWTHNSAVLRQAYSRYAAASLVVPDDEHVSTTLGWMRRFTESNYDTYHGFLEAAGSASIPPKSATAVDLMRFCQELIPACENVEIKSMAQRLLLDLGARETAEVKREVFRHMQRLSVPEGLQGTQAFIDQWLVLEGIRLESTINASHLTVEAMSDIKTWCEACVASVSGSGDYSHEAAVQGLAGMESLWKPMRTEGGLRATFFQMCESIYDLLNNDDEDVRDVAARVTRRMILSGAMHGTPIADWEVQFAKQKMLNYMIQEWGDCALLCHTAFWRAFGISSGTAESLRHRLTRLSETDQRLFAEEKQNLYLDEAQEVRVWSQVAQKAAIRGMSPALLKSLAAWVSEGCDVLLDQFSQCNGARTWNKTADMFTLELQLAYGAETLFRLASQGVQLAVAPSQLRRKLYEVWHCSAPTGAHELWRQELARVLTEAVVGKLHAVQQLTRAAASASHVSCHVR